MINFVMPFIAKLWKAIISFKTVSINDCLFCDAIANDRNKGVTGDIRNNINLDFIFLTALKNAKDYCFFQSSAASFTSDAFCTKVAFIKLNSTAFNARAIKVDIYSRTESHVIAIDGDAAQTGMDSGTSCISVKREAFNKMSEFIF